jgi:hypothetical protein
VTTDRASLLTDLRVTYREGDEGMIGLCPLLTHEGVDASEDRGSGREEESKASLAAHLLPRTVRGTNGSVPDFEAST